MSNHLANNRQRCAATVHQRVFTHSGTVEHPFGTLKQWMGATQFLTRKLAGVSAEMSLNVLAYNLKRVMKIIGANGLMKALTA